MPRTRGDEFALKIPLIMCAWRSKRRSSEISLSHPSWCKARTCQIPDLCGQVLGRRHVRALHQDGCDSDISLERRFDLQAHIINGIFKANSSPLVLGIGPVSADHYQHKVARGGSFLQYTAEVAA